MPGDAGLILTCAGCCCGHPAHGGALSPQRTLKSTLRRLHKASGLDGRVRLAFTECLGPCSEANVVLLYLHGRPLWFRRMNAPELIAALLDYSRAATREDEPALPAELAARSFSWTGGGSGPAPPVEPLASSEAAG
ncbi:MAG TPA: (2Fe-2S) ferredoxin domain-containing protein [Methylomirabilota bacterium]